MRSLRRRIAHGGFLLCCAVAIACGEDKRPQGALVSCPDHVRVLVASSTGTDSAVQAFQVPGAITLVPEYHDCQRLVDVTDRKFGALAAIFSGVGESQDPLPPRMAQPSAAAALIVSSAENAPLGIGPGNNCLYLWGLYRGDSVIAHHARMLKVGADESRCSQPLGTANAKVLHVTVLSTPGLVPGGSRWDHDPEHAQSFISSRCGAAWCEIGQPKTIDPTTQGWESAAAFDVAIPAGYEAVYNVKGWHDDQRLPIPIDPTATPKVIATDEIGVTPSSRAIVVPDTILQQKPDTAYFNNRWVPTVRVHLSTAITPYEMKFGLQASTRATVNLVSVCRVPKMPDGSLSGTCDGVTSTSLCAGISDPDPNAIWFGRIQGAQSGVRYHCVEYHSHGIHGPPFTARWRWPSKASTAPTTGATGGFGMPFGLFGRREPARVVIDEGLGLVGLWHWCAAGCCTIW
jgi:hypothetical protein